VLELRPGADLALPATDGTDGTDTDGTDTDGSDDGTDTDGTDTDGTDTDGSHDGTDTGPDGDDAGDSSGPDASTGDEAPGFGVVAALLGLLAALSLFARRSRD